MFYKTNLSLILLTYLTRDCYNIIFLVVSLECLRNETKTNVLHRWIRSRLLVRLVLKVLKSLILKWFFLEWGYADRNQYNFFSRNFELKQVARSDRECLLLASVAKHLKHLSLNCNFFISKLNWYKVSSANFLYYGFMKSGHLF